jgi:HAE1 family hydrophobic/amphiphilic exporter-1
MRRHYFLALLLCLPAAADEITPPQRVGVGITQRKLGLREAVELSLKTNLDIEIERTATATAREQVKAAQGYLDTTIRWQPLLESRNVPTGSLLLGANGKSTDHLHSQNFYGRQRLPWGGASAGLDFENSRQSTNNPFVGLNPYFTSRMILSWTQPLLRNRETDRERAEVKVRKKQVEISDVEFELKVIDIVTRVEQTYWDLVAARQDVSVNRDTVGWAREQLARNQRMIQSGTLAPVELAAAEAELERRLDNYYQSLGLLTQVENSLKTLISDGRDAAVWGDEIIPTDERMEESPVTDDLRKAVAIALEQRPELRSVELRRETNEIQKTVAKDQVKPQVNLVAAYINTGIGGSLTSTDNPFTASNTALYSQVNQLSARAGLPLLSAPSFGGAPSVLVGGFGDALSNLFSGRYQSFQGGLALDFTPRNRTAEANLAQTAIAERRLKLERTRSEQTVEAQVRNAMQAIETSRQRITAAEASERAAKEKLDSETRLFQSGESTNFLVLTRQNEYTDSRRRVVVSRLDYNRSLARVRQATGSSLKYHQITLQ